MQIPLAGALSGAARRQRFKYKLEGNKRQDAIPVNAGILQIVVTPLS